MGCSLHKTCAWAFCRLPPDEWYDGKIFFGHIAKAADHGRRITAGDITGTAEDAGREAAGIVPFAATDVGRTTADGVAGTGTRALLTCAQASPMIEPDPEESFGI
jgi:hypothetical protein